MANYPTGIWVPRDTENLPGITYDPADKKNMFAEDFSIPADEIVAIETILGVNPSNGYPTVADWIAAVQALIGGGWTLLGNAGTDPSVDFIGTTDGQDFVVRTNNVEVCRFKSDGSIVAGPYVSSGAKYQFSSNSQNTGAKIVSFSDNTGGNEVYLDDYGRICAVRSGQNLYIEFQAGQIVFYVNGYTFNFGSSFCSVSSKFLANSGLSTPFSEHITSVFSSLPPSPNIGTVCCITDSNTNVWADIISGGGGYTVMCWWTGSHWSVMGA